MAQAVTMSPGTYILGGLGRVQGESPAEALSRAEFDIQKQAANQEALRTTRLAQQQTLQSMRIREEEAKRAARVFQQQQADRARAAAERQRLQAAQDALIEDLQTSGRPEQGPPVAPITPMAPPTAAPQYPLGVPVMPTTPLEFPTITPSSVAPVETGAVVPPTDGVQVATLDPQAAFRQAFEARPDLFGGGVQVADATGAVVPAAPAAGQPVRTDMYGVEFDVYPDGRIVQVMSGIELQAGPEYDALRTQLLQQAGVQVAAPTAAVTVPEFTAVDPQSSQFAQDIYTLVRQGDIQGSIMRIGDRLATGAYGPMASPFGQMVGYFTDNPEEAARRDVLGETLSWFREPETEAFLRANPDLIAQAAADPVTFYNAYKGQTASTAEAVAAGDPPPAPVTNTSTADVLPETSPETTTAAETDAPAPAPTETTYGGLQLSFGTPVQDSFNLNQGQGSTGYVAAPENIFRDARVNETKLNRLDALERFYAATRNPEGVLQVQQERDQLLLEQRFLDGMTAIVGIQQGNFAPLQTLLQQRYPGSQVEVRPYTDGTTEIFIDGQSQARMQNDVLATQLRGTYDRSFIEQQAALAAIAAERSQFVFEEGFKQQARASADIAIETAKSAAEAANETTEINWTDLGDGTKIATIFGQQLKYVPDYPWVDPATGEETPGPALLRQVGGRFSQPVQFGPQGLQDVSIQ